jgi:hypothetical protein
MVIEIIVEEDIPRILIGAYRVFVFTDGGIAAIGLILIGNLAQFNGNRKRNAISLGLAETGVGNVTGNRRRGDLARGRSRNT